MPILTLLYGVAYLKNALMGGTKLHLISTIEVMFVNFTKYLLIHDTVYKIRKKNVCCILLV